MMENQVYNPKEEYFNVQQQIISGDSDMAQRWANGEFKDLKEQASSFVETPEVIHDSELVTPEMPETPLEPQGDTDVVTETNEDFDQEAHDRRVYDEEMARFQSQVDAAKAEALAQEAQAAEIKAQNDKLLKELEETRKANDHEDDFFGGNNETATSPTVETATENTGSVDNQSIQEIKAELEQLKNQQQEKDSWDTTVKSYGDFWSSEIGGDFSPEGNKEKSMKDFNEFYADLAEGINDRDALRLMHDIRKNGMNDFYKGKLDDIGIKMPSEFDKMYDSLEVASFAAGKKIDPISGKFVDSGKGAFSSMEDAYFILNRQKIVADEKIKAATDIRNKLEQRNNAAIQVEPGKYAPISTEMQNVQNPAYRQGLIKMAVENGYDGTDMNKITDPAIKQQMQELHANIKRFRQQ
jgi:hypothetical protein